MEQLSSEAPGQLLVVAVPLRRTRRRQRGFNKVLVLARCAIEVLHKAHPTRRLTLARLVRLRTTKSQAGLTPRQRRQNVRGFFEVTDPSAVCGRQIILVGDILTTGSTARAEAQSLIRAGAASVYDATPERARRNHVSGAQLHRTQPGVTPLIASTRLSSFIYQPSS